MSTLKSCFIALCVLLGGVSSSYAQTTEATTQADEAKYNTIAMHKMSDACVLLGQGKKDDAMNLLQNIDWKKTSITIGPRGMDYPGIVDFYMGLPAQDKASCDKSSQALFAGKTN